MDYLNLDAEDLAYMYELENELDTYDSTTSDWQEDPLFSPYEQFKNRSIVSIVSAVCFSLFLPAIIFVCHGFFLHVHVLRSSTLLLSYFFEITSNTCSILYQAHFFAEPMSQEPGRLAPRNSGEATVAARSYPVDVLFIFSLVFSLMAEFLALIFMRELHSCVCQLRQS